MVMTPGEKMPSKRATTLKSVPAVAAPGIESGNSADMASDAGKEPSSQVKLRDLVVRVAEVTGGNKKLIKETVEATLIQIGAALAKGEELNLPGVGKVRVARSSDRDGRTMMTLKVRGAGAPKAKEALAADPEDV